MMEGHTKLLLFLLAILVVVAYMYYYKTYKTDVVILQTFLDQADLNLLYERYPVVIYDQVMDPRALLKTLFSYSYMFKSESQIQKGVETINKSKYMMLWHNETQNEDVFVDILNPPVIKEQKSEVSIKLRKHQVIILPAFWGFVCTTTPLNCIRLDDLFSAIVGVL